MGNFKPKKLSKTKAPNKKINEPKFVELTFYFGHNDGGFANNKVLKAFLLFFCQLEVKKRLEFRFWLTLRISGPQNYLNASFR